MKRLMEALGSARKIEILLIAAMLCIMLLLCLNNPAQDMQESGEEARMQRLLSRIEGAGKVSVMIAEDAEGCIRGAVVAAQGAEDVRVALEMQRAIQALTGLELNQIEIIKSGG